jgi:hypothetical protein
VDIDFKSSVMNELLIEERLAAHGSYPGSRSYLPRLGDCPFGLSAGAAAITAAFQRSGSGWRREQDDCFGTVAGV